MPIHYGGRAGGGGIDASDPFAAAVERTMGDRLRADRAARKDETDGWYRGLALGHRLYSSITNQLWRHESGEESGYSFRAAGDLIAAIVGEGDYLDWYCSAPEGVVDQEVAELLAREGWRPIPAEDADSREGLEVVR